MKCGLRKRESNEGGRCILDDEFVVFFKGLNRVYMFVKIRVFILSVFVYWVFLF